MWNIVWDNMGGATFAIPVSNENLKRVQRGIEDARESGGRFMWEDNYGKSIDLAALSNVRLVEDRDMQAVFDEQHRAAE